LIQCSLRAVDGIPKVTTNTLSRYRTQPWQTAICLFVLAYLVLGVMTSSIRAYHWFLLLSIPGALFSAERGRRFFLDWSPFFAFWLVYDRLRLVQPLLFSRVAVRVPFLIERDLFGWMSNGDVPAHAFQTWLTTRGGSLPAMTEWTAQLIYFSHLFVVPIVAVVIWSLGWTGSEYRDSFARYVRAFAILNFGAIVLYLILPVAPPWWLTLNGLSQPTASLVATTDVAPAMHGIVIQAMIRNASQWFAAIPSLHGAYPVLLLMLGWPHRTRLAVVLLIIYGVLMWAATVALNQHYIIDLLAGAVLSVIAGAFVKVRTRSSQAPN